jgi:hypothetical protein
VSARAALTALESAYERLVWVLDLPAPLDDAQGGSPALDWYLEAGPLRVQADAPDLGYWDRAPAYCSGGKDEDASLERSAFLCVAEALALRLDAAEAPDARRAFATALWWSSASPESRDVAAIDSLQSRPERALSARELDAASEGGGVFYDYLDRNVSTLRYGALPAALFAVSAGRTAPGSPQWDNEPDTFDVLRHTLDQQPDRMAALLNDVAVHRAFVGARDDGAHADWLGWSSAFGNVRYDWVIPMSSLPRRVAATRPLQPLGSVYLWLALDRDARDTTLGFQAEWEPPVTFVWTLVRVGADGSELSRLEVPYQQRARSAEQRLGELAGTAAVLVIGTNLGGVSLAHPFDPDVAPYEANSCTIYLAKL